MQADPPPPSPCNRVCLLGENQVCVGCYRHVSEIMAWMSLTPGEQRRVIEVAAARRIGARPTGV